MPIDRPHGGPRFSVVIPLFNKREFIRAAIDSALAQTLPPIELIVVDDGSTDDSRARVSAIGDPRIKLIQQENAGPGPARNRGIAAASGDWIALLDGDDLWLPNHLESLASVIASVPSAKLVSGSHQRLSIRDIRGGLPLDDGPINARQIDYLEPGNDALIHTSSVAIARAIFDAMPGFIGSKTSEDTEFWLRLSLDHDIAVGSRRTSIYARGTGGLMEQSQAQMATTRTIGESPILATIERTLMDRRYASRHAMLRSFADAKRIQFSRSLIYNGQNAEARKLLSEVPRATLQVRALRALTRLPRPVLRRLSGYFSAAKSIAGHKNI